MEHDDRLFYGDIIQCYYYNFKTHESKGKVIKKDALLYNTGEYYIDLDDIGLYEAFKILNGFVPRVSIARNPFLPWSPNRKFLCALYSHSCGIFKGHKFVDGDSLREAYPYHKDQSSLVRVKVKNKLYDRYGLE